MVAAGQSVDVGVTNGNDVILRGKAGVGRELLQVEHMLVCGKNSTGSLAAKLVFSAEVAFKATGRLVTVVAEEPPATLVPSLTTTPMTAVASFNMLATTDTAFGPSEMATEMSLLESSPPAFPVVVTVPGMVPTTFALSSFGAPTIEMPKLPRFAADLLCFSIAIDQTAKRNVLPWQAERDCRTISFH